MSATACPGDCGQVREATTRHVAPVAVQLHQAASMMRARDARCAQVTGVEQLPEQPTLQVGRALLGARHGREEAGMPAGFAGKFARIADAYAARLGHAHPAMACLAEPRA